MAVFYLDTSAVLKRYRTEKGTLVVTELYEDSSRDILLTSHFTCLEFESVAARAMKGKLLTQPAYDVLLGSFAHDIGEFLLLIDFSGDLLNNAIDIARRYALRAPDAMHVAAAHEGRRRTDNGEFVFVTSDREQLAATHAAGMTTIDPEAADAMAQLTNLRSTERGNV